MYLDYNRLSATRLGRFADIFTRLTQSSTDLETRATFILEYQHTTGHSFLVRSGHLVSSPGVSADHQQSFVEVASVLESLPLTSVSPAAVNGSVLNGQTNNSARTIDDKSLQLILTHNWSNLMKSLSDSYTSSVTLQNEPLPEWFAKLIIPSTVMPLEEQLEYVKLWEGYLCCTTEGETRLMSKLHGYRRSTAKDSDTLAQDWPSTMFIERIVYAEDTNIEEYTGKVDCVRFRAEIPDGFRSSSQENVTVSGGWLDGLLIPADLVDFELPTSSEQQPEQHTGRCRIARSYPLTNRSRAKNRFCF
ncbi:mediator of RNA polymerase II transcription subunit 25 [Artemisia annua]|uniref:Mediator of RNA polymerase II transcription subunit 25 n=1 Tax=Artemisia annua TaxID=35608 RepID=A0A2U1QH93_ARTAN|nr:mediator of RNA polymerase II transcription subunit 25 [Artemisia annua]